MTDHTVDLDKHRGMAAQKATDLRRALAEVETAQGISLLPSCFENRTIIRSSSWLIKRPRGTVMACSGA
jgi:hypothetical protein